MKEGNKERGPVRATVEGPRGGGTLGSVTLSFCAAVPGAAADTTCLPGLSHIRQTAAGFTGRKHRPYHTEAHSSLCRTAPGSRKDV